MSTEEHVSNVAPITKSLTVAAPPERAFEVFTTRMATWWDPAYHLGSEPFAEIVVEPREGGRWFERDAGGAECTWGRVLAWEPPGRLVLAWQVSADWDFDPALLTEIEVRFTPAGAGATRVDFEHRGLDAYGSRAAEARATLGSAEGWPALVDRFGDLLRG